MRNLYEIDTKPSNDEERRLKPADTIILPNKSHNLDYIKVYICGDVEPCGRNPCSPYKTLAGAAPKHISLLFYYIELRWRPTTFSPTSELVDQCVG